ncbi:MAG: 6-phosphogluconolactonase [Acidimicrobiales bacterium]|jgi:6-phosphogluconolactonase
MAHGAMAGVPFGELRIVEGVPAAFAALVAEQAGLKAGSGEAEPFRLVLSGGSTARECYERLALRPEVDWSRVECLVGDERCVSADDPDANQRMIREALVGRVDPPPHFVPMDCEQPPEAYEQVITASAQLDLIHLGLGPDGHTASLFPNSVALGAPADRLVVSNVDPSGRNPHLRLTMTFAGISRARLAVFTVAGSDKREAMMRVLHQEDLPAARVRAQRVLWLCDAEAIGSGPLGLG